MLPLELAERVAAWLAEDPDPSTRNELQGLVERGDEAGLRDRFDNPLTFGTAGLRAPLGAGPARMNRAVVRRATAGLVSVLCPGTAGDRGVVVGHDARHLSAEMAQDAARVVAASGGTALWIRRALPTPITAFAVRYFGAAAGAQVTASHNPAPDNGFKVYASDGAQVIAPQDDQIARAASSAKAHSDGELAGPFADRLVEVDEQDLLGAYRQAIVAVLAAGGNAAPAAARRAVRCVYTPVHGVGGAVLPGLMEEAGFEPPSMVAAQAAPDPEFPTAPFPNPEEPGVLDLALADARRLAVDVVLANDPDADRLAVALPVPARGEAGPVFRVLTGDELGILIGDHLVRSTSGPGRLLVTTVVSSTMLAALARHAGVAYAETLTGFKWVARAAERRPGYRLLFGYEEALGYSVTATVADKDGMSAALVVAEMVARAKASGSSLLDRLDELDAELGVHATGQWSLRMAGSTAQEEMTRLMARWRAAPPERLAGADVTRVRDLLGGEADLPASDLLVLYLGDSGRIVLRPSGTEPKLKVYFEVATAPCATSELATAREEAKRTVGVLRQAVAGLLMP